MAQTLNHKSDMSNVLETERFNKNKFDESTLSQASYVRGVPRFIQTKDGKGLKIKSANEEIMKEKKILTERMNEQRGNDYIFTEDFMNNRYDINSKLNEKDGTDYDQPE